LGLLSWKQRKYRVGHIGVETNVPEVHWHAYAIEASATTKRMRPRAFKYMPSPALKVRFVSLAREIVRKQMPDVFYLLQGSFQVRRHASNPGQSGN
jgi:hypothetical protein